MEKWNFHAARNGHTHSMLKIGRAFLHKLPSSAAHAAPTPDRPRAPTAAGAPHARAQGPARRRTLPLDPSEAAAWLLRAIEAGAEPDAYYCLAQMVLDCARAQAPTHWDSHRD